MVKLDDRTLLHLRVKGIANELHRCAGRNVLWSLGTAVAVFAHRMCTIWYKSQIAGRVVCGSKVDIVAGASARDSVAMEKSFLQPVFEVLCGATATLVQLLDCRPPHSLYTLASEPQPSVRESCVFCASFGGLS